jgi:hypothetical protein
MSLQKIFLNLSRKRTIRLLYSPFPQEVQKIFLQAHGQVARVPDSRIEYFFFNFLQTYFSHQNYKQTKIRIP